MNRVSTHGNYQSALLDLMSAQTRSAEALKRVSTQKVAQDLIGFGRTSETLTALKSSQARIQGFMDAGKTVSERLVSQDLALNRVADGAQAVRQAIADALASGRLDGLMLEVQGQFQVVRDGLNARHHGRYLFAGGQADTPPVTAETLGDLTAAPNAAAVFINGDLKQASRLDEGVSMETGYLADEVGLEIMDILRDIQAYHEATPIGGGVDPAASAFLTAQLTRLDATRTAVTDMAARNGAMQTRVDNLMRSQNDQMSTLKTMLAGKTDADMAKALTDLELSQIAVQASAQVINQLRTTSLLDLLR